MHAELQKSLKFCGASVTLIAVLLHFTGSSDAVPHGQISYDEATQEKVIEALNGLGFTDHCMDYLKSGLADDCDKCIGSMQFTERLCVVLGGNPKVCSLRCSVKRCCSLDEENSIEPSNSPRAILLGIARNLTKAPSNSTRSCLQCLPVDEN